MASKGHGSGTGDVREPTIGDGNTDTEMPEIDQEDGRDGQVLNGSEEGSVDSLRGLFCVSGDPTDGVSMEDAVDPRQVLEYLIPGIHLPPDVSDDVMWRLVMQCWNEPPKREKLQNVNTLEDVLELLQKSKKILVVTGAGISVSCGIPDFRSRNGIYARLSQDFPELPEPQSMFDIHFFKIDPRPFFKFAKEIFPGQYEPSPSHRFILSLEKRGKLLRNYTQNIDTLERVAGITRVLQCHGSFETASCTNCHYKVPGMELKEQIFNEEVPQCPKCQAKSSRKPSSNGDSEDEDDFAVMKPDIVFFGESLPQQFHDQLKSDLEEADLLICMGSSLKVKPVGSVPNLIDSEIPQIIINKECLPHLNFDVELLGNCDDIVAELCQRLGWLDDITPLPASQAPSGNGEFTFVPPNRYIFNGAEISGEPPASTISEVGTEQDQEERCAMLSEGTQSRCSSIASFVLGNQDSADDKLDQDVMMPRCADFKKPEKRVMNMELSESDSPKRQKPLLEEDEQ